MAENKTYLSNNMPRVSTNLKYKTGSAPLLNLLGDERTQKLNLLVHSVINLEQTLILKGFKGTGKSSLLLQFFALDINDVDIYLLKAQDSMSFESIQQKLVTFVGKIYALNNNTMADILKVYAKENRQLVLLTDDADRLMSGLMSSLIEYAYHYKALRLVFSITPEAYKIKRATEHITSQCFFIELPLLNQSQCQYFVQNFIYANKSMEWSDKAKDKLIVNVFRETKGNLTDIILLLSKQKHKQPLSYNNISIVIPVVLGALSVFLLGVILWPESDKIKETHVRELSLKLEPIIKAETTIKKIPSLIIPKELLSNVVGVNNKVNDTIKPVKQASKEQPVTVVIRQSVTPVLVNKPSIISPVLNIDELEKNSLNTIKSKVLATVNNIKDAESATEIKEVVDEKKVTVITDTKELVSTEESLASNAPVRVEFKITPIIVPEKIESTKEIKKLIEKENVNPVKKTIIDKKKPNRKRHDNAAWMVQQLLNGNDYTLQLYTLSTKPQLIKVQRDLKKQGYDTYYLKNKSKKYLIFLGGFSSKYLAKKKLLTLPKILQNAWIRPFSSIQKSM